MSYKIITASDFIYELKQNIHQGKYSIQLFVNEYDFLAISDELSAVLENKVSLDLVISSLTEKKSLRLVNLFNRIIQLGGSVYWKIDHNLYKKEVHFMIIDKTFIINKSDYYFGESDEEKVKYFNNLFDGFREDSTEINLLTGGISIRLEADKTFIEKSRYVKISWDVKNAHQISMVGINNDLESKGELELLIKEDTIVKLEAQNREHKASKQIVIKMIKDSGIEMTVEALDPILEEYVTLKGVGVNKEQHYAFFEQKIKLTWNISNMGNFSESTLGDLPLTGEYVFKLTNDISFNFIFDSIFGTLKKRIKLTPVLAEEEENEQEKDNLKSKLGRFADFFSIFNKYIK